MRSYPWLLVGYTWLSSPIVLALAEGLANVAGTEDFSELAPLFILRAGMWGEVGDVGDLPSDVLGLAERFRGWATSSCDKQRRKECYHQTAAGTTPPQPRQWLQLIWTPKPERLYHIYEDQMWYHLVTLVWNWSDWETGKLMWHDQRTSSIRTLGESCLWRNYSHQQDISFYHENKEQFYSCILVWILYSLMK